MTRCSAPLLRGAGDSFPVGQTGGVLTGVEDLPDVLRVRPVTTPPDVTMRVPGSKSITNRALLCAALAEGSSTLSGLLLADDTAPCWTPSKP